MRAGNIGEFSLVLPPPGDGLSLQTVRATGDDLQTAFCGWRASGTDPRLGGLLAQRARIGSLQVTICSRTHCKLCGVVCEGESPQRRGAVNLRDGRDKRSGGDSK